jgi:hypothetical protein
MLNEATNQQETRGENGSRLNEPRTCALPSCRGRIPAERNGRAIFCSRTCAKIASRHAYEVRGDRPARMPPLLRSVPAGPVRSTPEQIDAALARARQAQVLRALGQAAALVDVTEAP